MKPCEMCGTCGDCLTCPDTECPHVVVVEVDMDTFHGGTVSSSVDHVT